MDLAWILGCTLAGGSIGMLAMGALSANRVAGLLQRNGIQRQLLDQRDVRIAELELENSDLWARYRLLRVNSDALSERLTIAEAASRKVA